MTEKRFNIEDGYYQGKSRPLIFDEESSDDYYFCGDYEDFKSICKQFNDFDITNKHLKKENEELKHENVNIMQDLDYYRAKSGSCEEGLFQKDKEIAKLKKENNELNSIKCFADNNGINIFKIDEAFRKCWNDNGKLVKENQFLKEKERDMLDYLKKEYDYIYKQKMKHLDDAILVRSYELIEYHIKSMIEHLEGL